MLTWGVSKRLCRVDRPDPPLLSSSVKHFPSSLPSSTATSDRTAWEKSNLTVPWSYRPQSDSCPLRTCPLDCGSWCTLHRQGHHGAMDQSAALGGVCGVRGLSFHTSHHITKEPTVASTAQHIAAQGALLRTQHSSSSGLASCYAGC